MQPEMIERARRAAAREALIASVENARPWAEARAEQAERERDEALRELAADDYEDQLRARVYFEARVAVLEAALATARYAMHQMRAFLRSSVPPAEHRMNEWEREVDAALGEQDAPEPTKILLRCPACWNPDRYGICHSSPLSPHSWHADRTAPRAVPEPARCPACDSPDPKVCSRVTGSPREQPHPHGDRYGCCPNPWHQTAEGER